MSPEEIALRDRFSEMAIRCNALEIEALQLATEEPQGHRRKALRRASADLLRAAETFEALAPDDTPF